MKRFDRTALARRPLAFIFAMILIPHADGETGSSYLNSSICCNRVAQVHGLIASNRSVACNLISLIPNTDDHLHNHGFFIDGGGIRFVASL